MISHKQVEEYILSMPNARLDYPFGENTAVYKVYVPSKSTIATSADGTQGDGEQRTELYRESTAKEQPQPTTPRAAASTGGVSSAAGKQDSARRGDWKMFALVAEKSDPVQISLKCDPNLATRLRERYETVMPGYHLNKKHWNTVVLTGQLNWVDVSDLIKHSYELVTGSKE